WPATDHVAMQMWNGLARVRSIVKNQTVSVLLEPELLGNMCRFQKQMSQHLVIFGSRFRNARDRLLGDYEHVHRCLGLDVAECKHLVVFVHNCGRNLPCDNFFEQGFAHDRKPAATPAARQSTTSDKSPELCSALR